MTTEAPRIRASRGAVKRSSWSVIKDFFDNSPVPSLADDSILVASVGECAEWIRYVEQDADEMDVLYEKDSLSDVEREDRIKELSKEKLIDFDYSKKTYVFYGLAQKQTTRINKKPVFEFPLPEGDGLKMLNTQSDFKLPYSIYAPTVDGERKLYEWNHNLTTNKWLTEKTVMRKKEPWSVCLCANQGAKGCFGGCLNRSVQHECSYYNCSFGHDDCGNRLFSNMTQDLSDNKAFATAYEVRDAGKKGLGLFATRSYNAGSLIVEYTGEVIDLDQVDQRLSTTYKDVSEYYLLGLESNLVIDAGIMGSVARFVNHSCDPNCEMQKWVVNKEPRIGLFAKREITVGEEITYDYNFDQSDGEHHECYCGSARCRGVIGKRPEEEELPVIEKKPVLAIEDKPQPTRARKRPAPKIVEVQSDNEEADPEFMSAESISDDDVEEVDDDIYDDALDVIPPEPVKTRRSPRKAVAAEPEPRRSTRRSLAAEEKKPEKLPDTLKKQLEINMDTAKKPKKSAIDSVKSSPRKSKSPSTAPSTAEAPAPSKKRSRPLLYSDDEDDDEPMAKRSHGVSPPPQRSSVSAEPPRRAPVRPTSRDKRKKSVFNKKLSERMTKKPEQSGKDKLKNLFGDNDYRHLKKSKRYTGPLPSNPPPPPPPPVHDNAYDQQQHPAGYQDQNYGQYNQYQQYPQYDQYQQNNYPQGYQDQNYQGYQNYNQDYYGQQDQYRYAQYQGDGYQQPYNPNGNGDPLINMTPASPVLQESPNRPVIDPRKR